MVQKKKKGKRKGISKKNSAKNGKRKGISKKKTPKSKNKISRNEKGRRNNDGRKIMRK